MSLKAQTGIRAVSRPRSLVDLRYVHVPRFLGLSSVYVSRDAKHSRSSLSDQPQTGTGRFVLGHCARVPPIRPALFFSTANTLLSSLPFPLSPTACFASHHIASHRNVSHISTALFCISASSCEQSRLLFTTNQSTQLTHSRDCEITSHREQSRLPISIITHSSIKTHWSQSRHHVISKIHTIVVVTVAPASFRPTF